jgi:hypothetical protein
MIDRYREEAVHEKLNDRLNDKMQTRLVNAQQHAIWEM